MHSLITVYADRSTLAKYVMIMKPAKFDKKSSIIRIFCVSFQVPKEIFESHIA